VRHLLLRSDLVMRLEVMAPAGGHSLGRSLALLPWLRRFVGGDALPRQLLEDPQMGALCFGQNGISLSRYFSISSMALFPVQWTAVL